MIVIVRQNGYRSEVLVLSYSTIGNIAIKSQTGAFDGEQAGVDVWAVKDA